MRRRRPRRLAFACYLVVATLALSELSLRWFTTTSGSETRVFGQPLLPWRVTSPQMGKALALTAAECPYLVPDPWLGWTIKPNGRQPAKGFASNNMGLRSKPEDVAAEKPAGVHRVLLLGDSFTHGDELPYEDTFGAVLQEKLGAGSQVLNGGVPGYGTDQAVLRYERELGPRLAPDVVILGIVREDIPRNVNLFRALLFHWTEMPWSKPRFVLDGAGLRLVNAPVVPPERVLDTLRHLPASPLAAFDACYQPDFYADDWRYASRTFQMLATQRAYRERRDFMKGLLREDGEGTLVTARIAKRFVERAKAWGATPLTILLPQAEDVATYQPGGNPPLRFLQVELERLGVPVLDLGPVFHAAAANGGGPNAFFVGGVGHPNSGAARLIADALHEWLQH